MKPEVSIILLSLLRQEETHRCIESIYAWTTIPFEIVIVDMGGSESIAAWLEELEGARAEVRVLRNENNVGTAVGRNQGAALASAEHLVFLDNDTEVEPGWLEPLLAVASTDSGIGACGSMIVSDDGNVLCSALQIRSVFVDGVRVETGMEFVRFLHRESAEVNRQQDVPWYPTTSLLVKREAFFAVGGFDEEIFLCEEDKDLGLSMGQAGFRSVYVPRSVVRHRRCTDPAYTKVRNDLKVIMRDIAHFRGKWQCKPTIHHSRSYLRHSGIDDKQIDRIQRFSLVNTVVEDDFRLSELIVTVTDRCNHSCSMCYYHTNLNSGTKELSVEEYRSVGASLGGLEMLWISGGEPFLRRDLPEICEAFAASNPLASIFVPSNGSQPKAIAKGVEGILDRCPDVRLTLMLSLEGLQEMHDRVHGRAGAFASVETTIRRLNFLRGRLLRQGRRFGILLNTVISSRNQHEVPALMDYVKQHLLVDCHTLSPLRGDPKDPDLAPPDGATFANLTARVESYFDFYATRGRLADEESARAKTNWQRRCALWRDLLDGSDLPFTCQAGKRIGVIEPDGGIRLCESFGVVGNVRDHALDFRAAWTSPAADRDRERVNGCSCTHACFIGASEGRVG